jgi:hypothetical protein
MSGTTRSVDWGDALFACAFHYPGGLKRAVERIHLAVGPIVGSRPSFHKLRAVTDPAALPERDAFRAWLLLVAFGEDPTDWGIAEPPMPTLYSADDIRHALAPTRPATARIAGWFRWPDLAVPALAAA